MTTTRLPLAAAALALFAASPAVAASAYAFTIGTPSSLTYSFTGSIPFGSGGTPAVPSTLIGENDPLKPAAERTRTKVMSSIFSCGTFPTTTNTAINITGAIAASGSSTGSPVVTPGGTFKLGIDPVAGACVLQDFNVNLVNSGTISAAANLTNFAWPSPGFCTVNPACTASSIISPITLPLGTVTVTSLLAVQAPGTPDTGTLTPAGANTWTFSVATTVTITPTVTFAGAPLDADPQVTPMVLSGTITVSGSTATTSATTTLNYAPPATVPGPQPPAPFQIPPGSIICSGVNLIMTLNLLSSTITTNSTANLSAAGPRIPCRCDTNNDGSITVLDIFAFLTLWFASNPAADFNGNGIGVSDIFDFLSCWFAKPLGC